MDRSCAAVRHIAGMELCVPILLCGHRMERKFSVPVLSGRMKPLLPVRCALNSPLRPSLTRQHHRISTFAASFNHGACFRAYCELRIPPVTNGTDLFLSLRYLSVIRTEEMLKTSVLEHLRTAIDELCRGISHLSLNAASFKVFEFFNIDRDCIF